MTRLSRPLRMAAAGTTVPTPINNTFIAACASVSATLAGRIDDAASSYLWMTYRSSRLHARMWSTGNYGVSPQQFQAAMDGLPSLWKDVPGHAVLRDAVRTLKDISSVLHRAPEPSPASVRAVCRRSSAVGEGFATS